MPDEKAVAVATYTARGREDAPAAPRHASLIVFVEINCFRPGDPQHCASQGVQLPSGPPPQPADVVTLHYRPADSGG